MRKLILAALLSLGTSSAASLPEVLKSDADTLKAACEQGTKVGSMPRTTTDQMKAYNAARAEMTLGRILTDKRHPESVISGIAMPIEIYTPSGMAFSACATAAGQLKSPPASALLPLFYVYVNGRTSQVRNTEAWNAILVFLDASGNEIKRLEPRYEIEADPSYWRVNCSYGSCSWYGKNGYGFNMQDAPTEYAKVRLLFARGSGVEERDYSVENFTQSSLDNSKK